jgi:hypothetical protein
MIIQTDKPLQPRREWDHYPTPSGTVLQALSLVDIENVGSIVDVGAGGGIWGQMAARIWPGASITGIEIRPTPVAASYHRWVAGDFRLMPASGPVDLVIGNPPFRDLEAHIRAALHWMAPDARLLFLAPLRFLEGQRRARGLWREHPPRKVAVLAKRPSFDGTGRTDATAYAIYLWTPDWRAAPELVWL